MPEQKCTLSDKELIDMCNQWVHSLAKTGGQSWILQVPVNFNRDPDMLFIELGKRFETLQAENSKMRKALQETQALARRGIFPGMPVEVLGAQMCIDINKLVTETLKKDGI